MELHRYDPQESNPIGRSAVDGAAGRASDPAYQQAARRQRNRQAIARAVVLRRGRLGWTQNDLADRMGTGKSQISRIENAEISPSVETLERLADALGVDLEISFEEISGEASDVAPASESSRAKTSLSL